MGTLTGATKAIFEFQPRSRDISLKSTFFEHQFDPLKTLCPYLGIHDEIKKLPWQTQLMSPYDLSWKNSDIQHDWFVLACVARKSPSSSIPKISVSCYIQPEMLTCWLVLISPSIVGVVIHQSPSSLSLCVVALRCPTLQ